MPLPKPYPLSGRVPLPNPSPRREGLIIRHLRNLCAIYSAICIKILVSRSQTRTFLTGRGLRAGFPLLSWEKGDRGKRPASKLNSRQDKLIYHEGILTWLPVAG